MNTNNEVSHHLVSTHFQVVCIILSSIFLFFVFYNPLSRLHVHDKSPAIFTLTPKMITEFGVKPAKIETGFLIHDFPVFDTITGEFIIEGILWFKFDPSIIALDTLSKFRFDNGEILHRSEPVTQVQDGKVIAHYDIRVKFHLLLQYNFFPLEDHRLHFVLTHDLLTPNEIIFSSHASEFIVEANLESIGWRKNGKSIQEGFKQAVFDELDPSKTLYRSALVFIINYSRISIRYLLMILLPLLLMFYLSLFVFTINPDKFAETVFSLSLGNIAAMLAYRFVIESFSPSVSYFMLSDYLFFIFLSLLFFIFFMCTYALYYSSWVKKFIIICLHIFVDGTIAYLVLVWVQQ